MNFQTFKPCVIQAYYVACVCSQYNVHSDWLILGHYSPAMPMSQLQACKSKARSHTINNLLTSNVQSLKENFKSWPCIDLTIDWSIWQGGLSLRFPYKDLTRNK